VKKQDRTGINTVWTNQKELMLFAWILSTTRHQFTLIIIPLEYGGNVTSPLTSVPTSYVSEHRIQSEEIRSEALQHTQVHFLSRHNWLRHVQMKAILESLVLFPPLPYSYCPRRHFSDPDMSQSTGRHPLKTKL